MSRDTRSMLSVAREPNGRRSRIVTRSAPQFAPTEVKRLRDAALAGMQNPEWGSELGRLLLAGKLEAELYAAGQHWAECATRYRQALDAPRPNPPPARFEPKSPAAAVDPASAAGQKQTAREIAAIGALQEAHVALRTAGVLAERVVRRVCEHDEAVCGTGEFVALRRGLLALALFWGMMRRK
jgi:hypothetical protein